jgi:hypothetical protein
MPIIDDAIKEGLATLEKATIRFYRGGKWWTSFLR